MSGVRVSDHRRLKILTHRISDLWKRSARHLSLSYASHTEGKAAVTVAVPVALCATAHLHPRSELNKAEVGVGCLESAAPRLDHRREEAVVHYRVGVEHAVGLPDRIDISGIWHCDARAIRPDWSAGTVFSLIPSNTTKSGPTVRKLISKFTDFRHGPGARPSADS